MATEVLRIIVEQRGATAAATGITRIGTAARQSSTAVQTLRNLLLTFGVGVGLRGLANTVDSFIQIENRIRLATRTNEQFNSAQRDLIAVAQETRQPLDATTELFRRLAVNTEDLGFSQERIIGLIRTINQSIAVSGATAQEARNGIIQLAQGFASGQLRGEEFRAVAEQLPGLLLAIADGTGLTVGQLRELAFAGGLSPQIVADAIETQADVIEAAFARITPTIEQAGTILGNAFTVFIGRLDQTVGASDAFGDAVRGIANNIDELATGFIAAIAAILAYAAATRLASAATVGLRTALVRTGVGALVVGLGLAINELLQFGLSTQQVEGVTVSGFDRIRVAVEAAIATLRSIGAAILESIAPAVANARALFAFLFQPLVQGGPDAVNSFTRALGTLVENTRREVNAIIGFFVSLPQAISIVASNFEDLGRVLGIRFLNGFIDFVAGGINSFLQTVTDTLNRLPGVDLVDPLQIPSNRISEPIIEGAEEALSELRSLFDANQARDFVGEFVSTAQGLLSTISDTFTAEQNAAFDRLLERLRAAEREEERLAEVEEQARLAAAQLELDSAADKEAQKFAERLGKRIADRLTDAFQSVLQGEAVDFSELFSEGFAALLKNSLTDVFTELSSVARKLVTDLTSNLSEATGGLNVGGALGALVGVGGLLLTNALRDSEQSITNDLVQSAVTDTTPVRGVVVGPTEIPIFQVGQSIEEAFVETNGILRQILAAIEGAGGSVANETTLNEQASAVEGLNGPTLF